MSLLLGDVGAVSWLGRAAAVGVVAGCAVGLAGCRVGPDYIAPPATAPEGWSEAMEEGLRAEGAELGAWWQGLNDPVLDSLVERAVRTNLDLREAAGRVREARALRGVSAADRLPSIDATGSYTRERFSENGGRFGMGAGESADTGSGSDLFALGFDASWEVDLFGRVARGVEAADAMVDAAEEDRRGVLVTLLSEVARVYTEVRSFQDRLRIAEANVAAQADTLSLVRSRFDAGLTSELDVAQARANLEQTRAQIPLLTAGARQSMHALEVLLGQRPGSLAAELEGRGAGVIPLPPESISVGLPSDLLRRRPDIRKAERELAAETARIGVVTADLFPRVMLTGAAGVESTQAGTLAAGDSFGWSVGPSVRWNLFSGGRVRSNIEAQTARQEQALARYERSVLGAFQDAENALVGYSRERVRLRSLDAAVSSQQRAVELSQELYTKGLTDFQNVLDAQRQLYSLQDTQAGSRRDVTTGVIALYKALGGGWDEGGGDGDKVKSEK